MVHFDSNQLIGLNKNLKEQFNKEIARREKEKELW